MAAAGEESVEGLADRRVGFWCVLVRSPYLMERYPGCPLSSSKKEMPETRTHSLLIEWRGGIWARSSFN